MKQSSNRILIVTVVVLSFIVFLQGAVIVLGPTRVYNAVERRARRFFGGSDDTDLVVVPPENLIADGITNDPLSRYQWGLRMMLDGATYDEVQGDAPRDVIVAVIDFGVHMNHPDLQEREAPGAWNFISNTPELRIEWDEASPNSSDAHGQCSASIIAADTNNGVGMAGVFHRARIMPLQSDGHISKAMHHAIDNGADVILVAGGGDNPWLWPMYQNPDPLPPASLYDSESIQRMRSLNMALRRAYANNVPVVTGVGNTRSFGMTLISDHHTTISVAPHNVFGEVSAHTSFSYSFDVFAPGGSRKTIKNFAELSSLFPHDLHVVPRFADFDDPLCAVGHSDYSFLTLGSAAMPHVAGAVAMIKSFLPDASVEEVRTLLTDSTIPLEPSESLLEGLGGRLSLRLLRENIDERISVKIIEITE